MYTCHDQNVTKITWVAEPYIEKQTCVPSFLEANIELPKNCTDYIQITNITRITSLTADMTTILTLHNVIGQLKRTKILCMTRWGMATANLTLAGWTDIIYI